MSAPAQDHCPAWAHDLATRIYLLEVEAGTIKREGQGSYATMSEDELRKVAAKLDAESPEDLSEEVEALFTKICRGLREESFSAEQISAIINHRIPTGCRLPYCSAAEVEAAFS